MGRFYDVCIVGGGAVGASVAYHLGRRASAAALPPLSVCVIERDPTLAACSSSLSVGGLRYQFSNAANVRMSQYGRQFLAKLEAHLGVDVASVPVAQDTHFFARADEPHIGQRIAVVLGRFGVDIPHCFDVCAGNMPVRERGHATTMGSDHDLVWTTFGETHG